MVRRTGFGSRRDFGSREVSRLTGIPYQTLDRWIGEGYLTCEMPADGTGSRRRFSFRDVVLAIVARRLKEHHLPMAAVKGMLEAIRQNWRDEDPAHAGFLVVKLWREATAAVWFENRERLADGVESIVSSEIEGAGEPTGVSVLVDVGFLAGKAREEVEAGIGG